jgi:hypothetical protein
LTGSKLTAGNNGAKRFIAINLRNIAINLRNIAINLFGGVVIIYY